MENKKTWMPPHEVHSLLRERKQFEATHENLKFDEKNSAIERITKINKFNWWGRVRKFIPEKSYLS